MFRLRLKCLSKTTCPSFSRSFSSSLWIRDQNKEFEAILDSLTNPNPHFQPSTKSPSTGQQSFSSEINSRYRGQTRSVSQTQMDDVLEPYHLHCYSHRHNTHLTLTRPNRNPLISMSTGNLGFKKGKRGDYESAFQLSAYFLRLMSERGYFMDNSKTRINSLEIVMRGFSEGRKAFLAALMGVEGQKIRKVVSSVSDATRLKIGGTRSPNPRRL